MTHLSLNRYSQYLIAGLLSIGIAACSSDISDLQKFVHDAKTNQKPKLQPLPVIKPYETFRYTAGHLKDPFEPTIIRQAKVVSKVRGKGKGGPKPIEGRAREVLESYPLDSLRMVGSLTQSDTIWALVQSNDGTIHRLKTGNYIGQNHGKIIAITEDKIQLTEIVPDGLGDWMERPATLGQSGNGTGK